MSRALTSRDIARISGFSQATVSRVLQGSTLVHPETRDAILKVIAESGYAPNAAARAMRTRRSNLIALVVANVTVNPLYPALLQELTAQLRPLGLLATVWEEEDFDERALPVLANAGVDGVIATTAMSEASDFLHTLAQRIPLVLIHRTVASSRLDQFSCDNRLSGEAVARYLLEGGRRRLGLISGERLPNTLREREEGFLAHLAAAGIAAQQVPVARVASFNYANGLQAARALMAEHQLDGIFGVNDIVAIGALDGLRQMGLRVPGDVWVVGADNVPMASWGSFDLTTVDQSRSALVSAAVDCLRRRLEGDDSPAEHLRVPYRLVQRGSSGGLGGAGVSPA
ncbi:LacI family DNA-binding transcriptional regulator [Comamonas humi]